MDEIAPTISEEEFSRWFTPRQSFHLLGEHWSPEVIRATLLSHLMHNLLVARAATMVVIVRGERKTRYRAPLHTRAWREDRPSYHSQFWINGLYDFTDDYASMTVKYACFDVRFDPDAVRALLPPPLLDDYGPPQPAPEKLASTERNDTTRPTVGRADLQRWHDLFKQIHPEAIEAFALRSAEAMFPDHHVPRAWVRELRGPQRRGKPPTRRE